MSDFVDKYVPEDLRYEDSENQIETVFSKIVSMFEDLLDGDILDGPSPDIDSNFLKEVDELYTYWDVLRNSYYEKVGNLIDPFDLRSIVATDEDQKGRFLYFLQNIYAIKGTEKAFKFCMRLAGMDAEAIQWYKPEYLLYRPEVETCHSVLKIMIGNHPLTEDMVLLFERLVAILLDVCFVISTWIFIKNLVDDVDSHDTIINDYISHCRKDRYSQCGFEIWKRNEGGKYGVYGCPLTVYKWNIVGFPFDPIHYEIRGFDHHIYEVCPKFHNCKWVYSVPMSYYATEHICDCGVEDLPYLVHIKDPIIRHGDPADLENCVLHDDRFVYNQRFDLWDGYYDCLPDSNIRPCGDQSIPYPRRLGEKEIVQAFENSGTDSYYDCFCTIDPTILIVNDYFKEDLSFTVAHNRSIYYDCVYKHSCGIYDTFITYQFQELSDVYELLNITQEELNSGQLTTLEDQVCHSRLHNSEFIHDYKYDRSNWLNYCCCNSQDISTSTNKESLVDENIIPSSNNRIFHNGNYFHDGTDWIESGILNIHGSTYRFPNSLYNSVVCHNGSQIVDTSNKIYYDGPSDSLYATTRVHKLLDHNNSWIHTRAEYNGDIVLNPGEDWELRNIFDGLTCELPTSLLNFNFIDPSYIPPPYNHVNFGTVPDTVLFNFVNTGYSVNPNSVDFEID